MRKKLGEINAIIIATYRHDLVKNNWPLRSVVPSPRKSYQVQSSPLP